MTDDTASCYFDIKFVLATCLHSEGSTVYSLFMVLRFPYFDFTIKKVGQKSVLVEHLGGIERRLQ